MFILRNLNLDDKFDKKIKDKIFNYLIKKDDIEYSLHEYTLEIKSVYKKISDIFASLLPKVSSGGIATVFANEMKKRQTIGAIHLILCYTSIIAILATAISFYTEEGTLNNFFAIKDQLTAINFLKLLSLEAPLAFLATLSAKKAHQNKRIYEEYTYKYTVAMTYVGLFQEIKEHEEIYGKDAVKNLNEGFCYAVFRNPSAAIDKRIDDLGTPFELVERLLQSIGQPAAELMITSKRNKSDSENSKNTSVESTPADSENSKNTSVESTPSV